MATVKVNSVFTTKAANGDLQEHYLATNTAMIEDAGQPGGAATLDADGKVRADQTCSTLISTANATSFTLTAAHAGKMIWSSLNTGAPVTVTIPKDVLPVGTEIEFCQGSSKVTFVPATGVTLNSPDACRTMARTYSTATLKQMWANIWQLSGDLE